MFADATLGARIDRAEGRLCARLAGARQPRPGDGPPLVIPVGGGVAVFAGRGSPINKVIGLGFDGELDEAALADVESQWNDRGEPVRVELSILSDPSTAAALSERGYRVQGFENVLARSIAGLLPAGGTAAISIEEVGDEGFEEWFAVAVDSFANMDGTGSASDPVLPREELERALRDVMGPEPITGMTRYLARVGGVAAGEAALNVEEGLALLAGSGTAPPFRGRGVQKALIAHRLAAARDAGCDLAVVVTAPGTRSQANVMRRGFNLLYTRAVLVRPIDAR